MLFEKGRVEDRVPAPNKIRKGESKSTGKGTGKVRRQQYCKKNPTKSQNTTYLGVSQTKECEYVAVKSTCDIVGILS